MAGLFDDLIPTAPVQGGAFDDLIPAASLQRPVSTGQGLLAGLQRGVKTAQEVFPAFQLIGAADRGPSIRQERAAFEQAMADPRYIASLTESFEQPKRAAEVEATLGPERRLDDIRTKQQAVKDIWSGVVTDIEKEKIATPRTEAQIRLGQATTPGQKWYAWLKNPIELTATIVAESLPASLAGAALGTMTAGPGVGTAAGVGLSSFATTLSSELLNEANRLGYDISDQQSLSRFISSKDFDTAFNTAITKSAPIASIDAATAGAAGRFIEPALKQGIGAVAKATGKEVLQQAIGGGGGEYLGQTISGQPRDWFDIAMESAAEVFTGPQEAVSNIRATRRLGGPARPYFEPGTQVTLPGEQYDKEAKIKVVPPVQTQTAPTTGVLPQPGAGTQAGTPGDLFQNTLNQSTVLQRLPDVASIRTKPLSDLMGRISLVQQSFGSVDTPSLRQDVLNRMFRAVQDNEILKSIIPSIPIDVVNNFSGQQFTPQMLLNDPSVLIRALSSGDFSNVVTPIVDSIIRSPAFRAAEVVLENPARGAAVLEATVRAGNLKTSEVPSVLRILSHEDEVSRMRPSVSSNEPVFPLRPGTKGTPWDDQQGRPVRAVPDPDKPGDWKYVVVPEETKPPSTTGTQNAPQERQVTQGNIGEYPNRNAPRETTETGNRNRILGRGPVTQETQAPNVLTQPGLSAEDILRLGAAPVTIEGDVPLNPDQEALIGRVKQAIERQNIASPALPLTKVRLSGDEGTGSSVMYTIPGSEQFDTIWVNPHQLSRWRANNPNQDIDRFVAAIINEELIHNASGHIIFDQWNALDRASRGSFNMFYQDKMREIYRELTPEQIERTVNTYGSYLSEPGVAAEFVRMVVQERMRGQITEETLGPRIIQHLKDLLRKLIQAFQFTTDPQTQSLLQSHVEAIQSILTEQGQNPFDVMREAAGTEPPPVLTAQQERAREVNERIRGRRPEAVGAGAINPKQNELLKSFYESANRVAARTEYGQRIETPDRKSYVATWFNSSKSWNLSRPNRTERAPDPYDVSAREEFNRRFPRGRPNFLTAGEGVNLDSNQILIPANSLQDAGLIAQYLPTLPTDVYSAENNPLLQIRQGASEEDIRSALERYADIHETGPIKPDIVAAVDKFMDAIRSPEQRGAAPLNVAPVTFLQVQPGMPELVWYKLIGDITSPDGRVYPAGRNISNGELARFGYAVPPEELAKATAEQPERRGAAPIYEDEEGKPTNVMGVTDYVKERPGTTIPDPAAVAHAKTIFDQAGIKVVEDPEMDGWRIVYEGKKQNAEGQKLVDLLTRELAAQHQAGKPQLAPLVNAVRLNFKYGTMDQLFDLPVRLKLYAIAQGEASRRGMELRALAGLPEDITFASQNIDVELQHIYSEMAGGEQIQKVLDQTKQETVKALDKKTPLSIKPEMQQEIDKANAIRDANAKIPNAAQLADDIFKQPFESFEDLANALKERLMKEYNLSPQDADKVAGKFRDAFAAPFKAQAEKSLQQVRKTMGQLVGSHRGTWDKIQKAISKGVFNNITIVQQVAKELGMKIPTEEEIKNIKALAARERQIGSLTEQEIEEHKKMGTSEADLLKAKEARLESTTIPRGRIRKQLELLWGRLTKPIPGLDKDAWRGFKNTKRNLAAAINEFMSANLLFKIGFPSRLGISVLSQWLVNTPTRAIGNALVRYNDAKAKGQQTNLLGDMAMHLGDSFKAQYNALIPALTSAKAALLGRGEARNIDRLMSGMNTMERLTAKAKEYYDQGDYGRASILYMLGSIKMGYRVAQAMDNLQGVPAEYQEMRARVINGLLGQGMSRGEALARADFVIGDMKQQHAEALADTKKSWEAAGVTGTANELSDQAWNLVKLKQYQRIKELGLPADEFREQIKYYRNVLAWNEAEHKGIGGGIARFLQRVEQVAEAKGFPTAFTRFSNAIGITINRALAFTPFYKQADYGGYGTSGWFKTEADRQQRRVEAFLGTTVGTAAFMLALSGSWLVRRKWPKDKEEQDLWQQEGHRPGTVEVPVGDGSSFITISLNNSPLQFIAPYLAAGGALHDLLVEREAQQKKLDEEAAKTGATPGQIRPMSFGDMALVAVEGAKQAVIGGRTPAATLASLTYYGLPNAKKMAASYVSPAVPGLPALQEVSRMAGVALDERFATLWDFLLPLPGSEARRLNMLGDPVKTPNDIQRVTQIMTGGNYPFPIDTEEAKAKPAYDALFASGYRPPSINPAKGYQIGGQYRPMNNSELDRYIELRGRYFKEGLIGSGAYIGKADAQRVYEDANRRALAEIGVTQPLLTTGGTTTTRGATTTRRPAAIRGPRRLRSISRLRRPRLRRLSYRTPRLALRRPRLRRMRRLAA